jgi:hypothetical protein
MRSKQPSDAVGGGRALYIVVAQNGELYGLAPHEEEQVDDMPTFVLDPAGGIIDEQRGSLQRLIG